MGQYVFITRAAVADVMDADHVMTSRAIGLRPLAVRKRHVVPSARLPIVTQIALNFGFVLGGAITVEALFSWPGVGLATIQAIQDKDFPMLQGIFLVTSAMVIIANLARRPALRAARPQGAYRVSAAPHDAVEAARRIRDEHRRVGGGVRSFLRAIGQSRRGQVGLASCSCSP